uniref:Uncharacterized protein n=1 Tax=Opuntia streptacantha TaxID=393608 RepID=A0A7C9AUX9_OPUST
MPNPFRCGSLHAFYARASQEDLPLNKKKDQLDSMDFVLQIAGYPPDYQLKQKSTPDSSENQPFCLRSLLDWQNLNLINPLMHTLCATIYSLLPFLHDLPTQH